MIPQPNRWSCSITSLAILLEASVDELTAELGHDGSEIVFPEMAEPYCRQGFDTQELFDLAYARGYLLTEIVAMPVIHSPTGGARVLWDQDHCERRLKQYMAEFRGLVMGCYSAGKMHMVAWDKEWIYDPHGPRQYKMTDESVQRIQVESFFALTRFR